MHAVQNIMFNQKRELKNSPFSMASFIHIVEAHKNTLYHSRIPIYNINPRKDY